MSTVMNAGTSDVQASFAPVVKRYGVGIHPCPPRRGNREGVVEKSIDYITQSWPRTARVGTPTEAQASLDRWCAQVADQRLRESDDGDVVTVASRCSSQPHQSIEQRPRESFRLVIEVRLHADDARHCCGVSEPRCQLADGRLSPPARDFV